MRSTKFLLNQIFEEVMKNRGRLNPSSPPRNQALDSGLTSIFPHPCCSHLSLILGKSFMPVFQRIHLLRLTKHELLFTSNASSDAVPLYCLFIHSAVRQRGKVHFTRVQEEVPVLRVTSHREICVPRVPSTASPSSRQKFGKVCENMKAAQRSELSERQC